jgi:negative regulator of sigma F NrsF-like protein
VEVVRRAFVRAWPSITEPFLSDLSFLNEIPDPIAAERPPPNEDRPRTPRPPAPTRSVAQRRRLAALAISLAWLCTHLLVYGVRSDFETLPAAYVAAQVVVPVVLATGCLFVALAPGKLGLGVGIGLLGATALLGPLSFWVLALGAPVPHAPVVSPLGFWRGSLRCLDTTAVWAAAPLLLVGLSLRRAFATSAAWRSAVMGAGLGLLSGAAINLHCSNVDRWHMLVGHAVPVALAALVGAFLVARWTRA